MLQQVEPFITYFEGIRRRTMRFVGAVPPEQIDWAPRAGEFSCGDIIRHLAATEQMFVGVAATGTWNYAGHARAAHPGLDEATAYLHAAHAQALETLRSLSDEALHTLRPALKGSTSIPAWQVLMLMAEHEVHHRSQLASYLTLLDVSPPHLYGLGVEDVMELATG